MDEKQQSRGLNISVLWHNFLRVLPRMIWLPLVLGAALGFWRYRQLTKNYVPVYSASSIYRVIANRGGKMDITSYGFYLDSNAASNLASSYDSIMGTDYARSLLKGGLIGDVGGNGYLTGVGGVAIVPLHKLVARLRIDTDGGSRALAIATGTGGGAVRGGDIDRVLR